MKINIGGGKGYDSFDSSTKNWTVIDIRKKNTDIVMDVSKEKLPFDDNSVKAIYTSHTLEHILPHRLPFVFSEFNRVLKPSAPIRIVGPDIDKAIKAYVENKIDFLKDKRNPAKLNCLPAHPICHLMGWFFTYRDEDAAEDIGGGHVMSFNFELLKYYLEQSNFKDINRQSFKNGNSIFKKCDFDRYKKCSLYMEAIK